MMPAVQQQQQQQQRVQDILPPEIYPLPYLQLVKRRKVTNPIPDSILTPTLIHLVSLTRFYV